jgi:glycerol transport system substrate-binding protein
LAGQAWSAKVKSLAWRRVDAAGQKYLSGKDVPSARLANEKPKGETIAYDTRLNACKAGKAR